MLAETKRTLENFAARVKHLLEVKWGTPQDVVVDQALSELLAETERTEAVLRIRAQIKQLWKRSYDEMNQSQFREECITKLAMRLVDSGLTDLP